MRLPIASVSQGCSIGDPKDGPDVQISTMGFRMVSRRVLSWFDHRRVMAPRPTVFRCRCRPQRKDFGFLRMKQNEHSFCMIWCNGFIIGQELLFKDFHHGDDVLPNHPRRPAGDFLFLCGDGRARGGVRQGFLDPQATGTRVWIRCVGPGHGGRDQGTIYH
jgi:hypothetical protein